MSEIVSEPGGFACLAGFVKSRPENNEAYLEFYEGWPEYPAIRAAHEALEAEFPGYNISQIKDKFGKIRFYVTQGNHPDATWSTPRANAIIDNALKEE